MNNEVRVMIDQKNKGRVNKKAEICAQISKNSQQFYSEMWEKLVDFYYQNEKLNLPILVGSHVLYKKSDICDMDYWFYMDNFSKFSCLELGDDLKFVKSKNQDGMNAYYPISMLDLSLIVSDDDFKYRIEKENGIDILHTCISKQGLENHMALVKEKIKQK